MKLFQVTTVARVEFIETVWAHDEDDARHKADLIIEDKVTEYERESQEASEA